MRSGEEQSDELRGCSLVLDENGARSEATMQHEQLLLCDSLRSSLSWMKTFAANASVRYIATANSSAIFSNAVNLIPFVTRFARRRLSPRDSSHMVRKSTNFTGLGRRQLSPRPARPSIARPSIARPSNAADFKRRTVRASHAVRKGTILKEEMVQGKRRVTEARKVSNFVGVGS